MSDREDLPNRSIRISNPDWEEIENEALAWGMKTGPFCREVLKFGTLWLKAYRNRSLFDDMEVIAAAVKAGRGTALSGLIDEQIDFMRSKVEQSSPPKKPRRVK